MNGSQYLSCPIKFPILSTAICTYDALPGEVPFAPVHSGSIVSYHNRSNAHHGLLGL